MHMILAAFAARKVISAFGNRRRTNWPAEQAIRPAVVNRKVWGGNRTMAGGKAQSVLMSVIETARRGVRSVVDHIAGTLRAFGNSLLPRPVLLPVR